MAQHLVPRRWPRRVLIGANIFVAFCVLITAAGYGYVRIKFGQIKKIDACQVLRRCGQDDSGTAMNVLLVGSDTRADVTSADQQHFGSTKDVSGQRSDTIMVLHVDPHDQKAAILSIPRDMYVPIAGTTHKDRVNTAFERGPQALIQTITNAFGIPIDHYASVDFVGFRSIVNTIGGVTIPFAAPARDKLSGLDIKTAGCISLNGDQALAYARSRHYETFESGRWRTDPTGDLGRIERQQGFIRRVMRRAISRGIRNPTKLFGLVNDGVKNVTIDKSLSTKDILKLGNRFKSLEPDAVDMVTLPGNNAVIGGADVLTLKQPDAQQIIDRFSGRTKAPTANGPIPNILPSTVHVRVLNGTGVSGEAGKVALDLQHQGFSVVGTGDARAFGATTPVVSYGRGQEDKAKLLVAYMAGGATLKQDLNIQGVDVVLTTASGFGGIRAPGTANTTSSTTKAATVTTTPQSKGAVNALNC